MSPTPDGALADIQRTIADLHRQLAASNAERDEALARESATAEILQVINSSPGDLTPVFGAMLEKAICLCEADFGVLWTFDGDRFRPAAMRGVPVPWVEFLTNAPTPFGAGSGPARVLAGQRFHQVVDFQTDPLTLSGDPHRRALVELAGARTGCAVSLRKDDALLGVFLVFRQEVRPFSERQIALLLNFGDQAVIAMENARLLTETREALERQTATAEVLQVINTSPGNLAPVFDAMLEKATSLCGAAFGELITYDGERFETAATWGVPAAFAEFRKQEHSVPERGSLGARVLDGELVIHVLDLKDADAEHAGLKVATRRPDSPEEETYALPTHLHLVVRRNFRQRHSSKPDARGGRFLCSGLCNAVASRSQ